MYVTHMQRLISSQGCGSRELSLSRDFTERMASVTSGEKAALSAFFKGKRGDRKLIEHPPGADCAD